MIQTSEPETAVPALAFAGVTTNTFPLIPKYWFCIKTINLSSQPVRDIKLNVLSNALLLIAYLLAMLVTYKLMIRHSAWFKIYTPFDLSASGTRKSADDRLSATSYYWKWQKVKKK